MRSVARLVGAIALAAPLFFTVPGLADDRIPSTLNCPEGAEPASVHGAAECYPTTCSDSSGCKSGYVCAERGLCIEDRLTGGFAASSRIALASCASRDACKYPAQCETAMRCVKESSGAKLKRACGCTIVGAASGGEMALVVLVAMAAWRLRKKRR